MPKFLGSHPGAAPFIGRLMRKPIPASYARTGYHAEHAFVFIAADGMRRNGRYHWVPEAGEAFLTPEEGGNRSAQFLRDELAERLRRGPATFRLQLQIGAAGDPTNDPTVLWPDERERVELGRLQITGLSPTSAEDEKRLIFDPTHRPDGIELSDDPILNARSAAYSISYAERNPRYISSV